jgi:hypothetical protein
MLPLPAYYTILAICAAYVLAKGGAPEKVGIAILAIGSVLSTAVISAQPNRFSSVETGVFLVDVAALVALLLLALRAERYWPLWITALQLIATAGHLVKMVDSHVIRAVYAFVMAFWTYPMLLLVVAGTRGHQRRLARFGADRSWSSFSGRSEAAPRPGLPG